MIPMERSPEDELMQVSADWDRAMVTNDADAIGRFISDDWVIIGTDGRIDTKAQFLDVVRRGVVTHDVMETHDMDIRVHGDAAVVIGRGVSGGTYQGQQFLLHERVSSVFVREGGEWRCVSTHLSSLDGGG